MSLRGRLLTGLVALVTIGMLVSDVVTYTALRSFLIDRIDQQLQETVRPAAQELELSIQSEFRHGRPSGRTIIPAGTDARELIRRYLAAFGPATVADVQAWSGLAGLKPVVEALRPKLRTFRDERGRELFDVPDGPLPDADTPAPARFLADWDNTILSHADRTRVVADEHRKQIVKAARVYATFLVDGVVAGIWRIEKEGRAVTLVVQPFRRLAKAERAALTEEAEPLVRFVRPEAACHGVRFAAAA